MNNTLIANKSSSYNHSGCRNTVTKPLECDSVSFGRTAGNAKALRALMMYGIPDIYSGKNVISPEILENLYARHAFSKSIKNIIKLIKPYEGCLQTVERQFFSIVKAQAKANPQYKLEDVVKKIASEHNRKLLELQQPIFDRLTEMSKEMSEEKQVEFNSLMDVMYRRLKREPVLIPFSAKEFQYKLQRIADENAKKSNPHENSVLNRMIRIAKKMPEKTDEESILAKSIESKVKRNRKMKNQKALIRKRADILTRIEMIRADSGLVNNQELNKLFSRTRSKIYNIPTTDPFNRKSFIHELQKITETLDDQTLAHRMIQQAAKLPTSHDNLSAFVMKCVEYSSDKIGFNMVSSSCGCIDHLVPYSKNGKDTLENYGICSAYYNSERGDRSIAKQLRIYPQTYEFCQKQVDRLIELCNSGVFKKVGLSKQYIVNFARRMYNLSPEDNRLVLNIDNLR